MNVRPSIISSIRNRGYFITIIFFVTICIGPFVLYSNFLSKQTDDLYDYIKTPSVSASDALNYSYENGYWMIIEDSDYHYIQENGDTCNAVKVERQKDMTVAAYDNDCGILYFYLNSNILDQFLDILFIYGIVVIILFAIYNYVLFKIFNRWVSKTINNISAQVSEIKATKELSKGVDDYEYYQEFEEVFVTIFEASEKIRSYVHERSILGETLNHELKTPLNKINSLLQAYEMKLPGYDDEKVLFELIYKEIDTMTETINYSLNLFANANETEEVLNVNQLIKDLIDSKAEDLEMRMLSIKVEERGYFKVKMNRANMELVLSNLLTNAIKYAKEDTKISIIISETQIGIFNQIDSQLVSGTQRGLKLSTQILKLANLKLSFREHQEIFEVFIKK